MAPLHGCQTSPGSLPSPTLADIKTTDWSEEVAPFWGEVIKTAFTTEGITGLLRAGWTTIKGALVRRLRRLAWWGRGLQP